MNNGVRRIQNQPDSWRREGKWRSDIYSSLRHCLIPKCIPVQHSTFLARDTTHLDQVNPGKGTVKTVKHLPIMETENNKTSTGNILPEPPIMWRRSYSCRREDTALRVSPYGRFLNTT